ncbi:MAG TPA: response regulator transcription factor [Gaiellaceae bacterium]|nr:response regulator transcription factor [Gaiellaceae bacterium]
MTASSNPTCVVADDHPALLGAVVSYLDASGFDVIGTAQDGARACSVIQELQPDVALVDFRMPRVSGAALVAQLREESPQVRLLVYTADAEENDVTAILSAGASGIILKEAPLIDLIRALNSALAGGTYIDPGLATAATSPPGRSRALTAREVDVLALLAEGLSYEQIGLRLTISGETVRTHVRKATDRLGAGTTTEAVATALRKRLIV